ncbi:MAG: ATP-binding protein, partial [Planctomycetota bacterium]
MSAANSKKTPALELDKTRDGLERLGLSYAAEAMADLVSRAVKDEKSPLRFLDQLLASELDQREERRVRTSLRLSSLPQGMTLDNFDFG